MLWGSMSKNVPPPKQSLPVQLQYFNEERGNTLDVDPQNCNIPLDVSQTLGAHSRTCNIQFGLL